VADGKLNVSVSIYTGKLKIASNSTRYKSKDELMAWSCASIISMAFLQRLHYLNTKSNTGANPNANLLFLCHIELLAIFVLSFT